MATLGKAFIAGTDRYDGKFQSGATFFLSSESPMDYLYESKDGEWQVEFQRSETDVVVRTKKRLNKNSLLEQAFENAQLALDVTSVKNIFSRSIADANKSRICVFHEEGKSILSCLSAFESPMSVSVQIKQMDKDGNEVQQAPAPEPAWTPSFRYYRLSQASTDLFEAYRNMFLGLEALLSQICPKKKKESETDWLKRSLIEVSAKADLSTLLSISNESPVDYIVRTQYKNIRCRLQHAKHPDAALPHSLLNPDEVSQAYAELLRLWRHLAGIYFNVPTGGGVITYVGFELMMRNVFAGRAKVSFTADSEKPRADDTRVSPNGLPAYEFDDSEYLGAVRPGVVAIVGRENLVGNAHKYRDPIHRICCQFSDSIFGVSHTSHGLMVAGVDVWESVNEVRLINSSQPVSAFKT